MLLVVGCGGRSEQRGPAAPSAFRQALLTRSQSAIERRAARVAEPDERPHERPRAKPAPRNRRRERRPRVALDPRAAAVEVHARDPRRSRPAHAKPNGRADTTASAAPIARLKTKIRPATTRVSDTCAETPQPGGEVALHSGEPAVRVQALKLLRIAYQVVELLLAVRVLDELEARRANCAVARRLQQDVPARPQQPVARERQQRAAVLPPPGA